MPNQKQIEILAKGLAQAQGWLWWTPDECAADEGKAKENQLNLDKATALATAYEDAGSTKDAYNNGAEALRQAILEHLNKHDHSDGCWWYLNFIENLDVPTPPKAKP